MALKRGLERAEGFALFLVQVNVPTLQQQIAAWLSEDLTRPLVEVRLRPDLPVYEQLESAASRAPRHAVLSVTGLEAFSEAEDRAWLLHQFNWRRNLFPNLQRPLLLWLPPYLLVEFLHHAPDFADWYSGFYEFSPTEDRRQAESLQLLSSPPSDRRTSTRTSEERTRRIAWLRELLDEYREAGDAESELARARIHIALGRLCREAGNLRRAREHYEQALSIRKRLYGPEHPEVAAVLSELEAVPDTTPMVEAEKCTR